MSEHDKLAEARAVCPCWGDGETGPRECGDGGVCELHAKIADALASARAEGAAEAYERAAKACIEAEARYRADADEAAERDQPLNWSASDGCAITAERLAAAIRALAKEAAE